MKKQKPDTRQDAPGATLIDVPLPFPPPDSDRPTAGRQPPDVRPPPDPPALERRSWDRRSVVGQPPGWLDRRVSDRRYAELLAIFGGRAPDARHTDDATAERTIK